MTTITGAGSYVAARVAAPPTRRVGENMAAKCINCGKRLKLWEIAACGACLRAMSRKEKDSSRRRCYGTKKRKKKT